MTVDVELAPRALRDVLDCSIWWSTHHPRDANHFDDELDKAIELIKQGPRALRERACAGSERHACT